MRRLVALLAAGQVFTGRHFYLSTGCLHNRHDYCQAQRGRVGPKKPARCKFCDAPCRCRCHRAAL